MFVRHNYSWAEDEGLFSGTGLIFLSGKNESYGEKSTFADNTQTTGRTLSI